METLLGIGYIISKILSLCVFAFIFYVICTYIGSHIFLRYEYFKHITKNNNWHNYLDSIDDLSNYKIIKKRSLKIYVISAIVGILIIAIVAPIYISENNNNYSGQYYVYIFEADGNAKNYKLPADIKVNDDTFYIEKAYWPNQGYIYFDQEVPIVEAFNGAYIYDHNDEEYFIEFKKEKVYK